MALRYRNDRSPCGADLAGPNHGKPPAWRIIRRELRKTGTMAAQLVTDALVMAILRQASWMRCCTIRTAAANTAVNSSKS